MAAAVVPWGCPAARGRGSWWRHTGEEAPCQQGVNQVEGEVRTLPLLFLNREQRLRGGRLPVRRRPEAKRTFPAAAAVDPGAAPTTGRIANHTVWFERCFRCRGRFRHRKRPGTGRPAAGNSPVLVQRYPPPPPRSGDTHRKPDIQRQHRSCSHP